jgi:DNA topoisomerase-1
VQAYFARLAIDYLIGYVLSPLSWKLGKNFSVGRVQTCGLKVIIEKEEEILNFVEELFYTIQGMFKNLLLQPKLTEFKEEEINRLLGI